jgi:DNA polymerase elongation subunit (family B)
MSTERLTAVPYSIVKHEDEGQPQQLYFWCFRKGPSPGNDISLLRVYNTPTFANIELPVVVGGRRIEWNDTKANLVAKAINSMCGRNIIIRQKLTMQSQLYYYQNKKLNPYLFIVVETERDFYAISKKLEGPISVPGLGMGKYALLEGSEIPLATKLLTVLKMDYSQYFNADVIQVEDQYRVTSDKTCPAGEWKCDYNAIKPIPLNETTSWITHPKVMSIDGEMHSALETRFPTASFSTDSLWMWSITCQFAGMPETRKCYLLVDGPPPDFTCNTDTDNADLCKEEMEEISKYRGYEVIPYCKEGKLVLEFARIIDVEQPTVFIGWNVYFDYGYLDARLKRKLDEWPMCGRIPSQKVDVYSMTWKSSAYATNTITYPQWEGRIHHDMMTEVKRNFKLIRYSLGYVAEKFLGSTKVDISYKSLFRLKNLSDSIDWDKRVVKKTCDKKFIDNLRRHNVVKARDYIKFQSTGDSDKIVILIEWIRREYSKTCRYGFFDTILPILLFERFNSWIAMVEMANIVKVPIDQLSTRGQQIRVHSQLYQECKNKSYVMRKRPAPSGKFCGAHVYPPTPGLYKNVDCEDFASLYPMIMTWLNLCYTTLIYPEHIDKYPPEMIDVYEWDEEVEVKKEEDCAKEDKIYDIEEDGKTKKIIKIHHKHAFVKAEYHKGILPEMVYRLVTSRREIRARIKLTTDEIAKKVLDAQQLGCKVSCNSVYGFTGTGDIGKLPCREISETVTFVGRQSILKCSDYTEENYGTGKDELTTVYGDTDSVMIGCPSFRDYMEKIIKSTTVEELIRRTDMISERSGSWEELQVCLAKFKTFVSDGMMKEARLSAEEVLEEIDRKDPSGLRSAYHMGKKLEGELTGLFGHPMEMEFENCYARFFILTKKRYCAFTSGKRPIYGLEYEIEDHNNPGVMIKKKDIIDHEYYINDQKKDMVRKGVITAKRTECTWLKEFYDELMYQVLKEGGIEYATNLIFDEILKLKTRGIDWHDLIIVREYSGAYKSGSFYLAVFGELMTKKGTPIKPGERLDLLYVKPEVAESYLQGYKLRTTDDYLEKAETEPIDVDHIIGHQAQNPIEQVYQIAYKDEIAKSEARYPGRNLNVYKSWYNSNPIKNLLKLFKMKEDVCKQIRETQIFNSGFGSSFMVKDHRSGQNVIVDNAIWKKVAIEARKAYSIEVQTCRISPDDIKALPDRRKAVQKSVKNGEIMI